MTQTWFTHASFTLYYGHKAVCTPAGLVRTAKLLDRETKAQFILTAIATDIGGLSCTASVVVSLKDVNDNPPRFAPGSLRDSYSIREDAQIHTLLTRVVAHDADTGKYYFVAGK